MIQRKLFPTFPDSEATAAPAQRHSRTSVAAAEAIEPHLNKLERLVMNYLEKAEDGGTDEEIAIRTGLRQETARARRIHLRDIGMIANSSKQRPTSSGRAATVWVLTKH